MKRLSSCELLHKLKNGLEVPTNPEVGKKTTVTLVKSARQRFAVILSHAKVTAVIQF